MYCLLKPRHVMFFGSDYLPVDGEELCCEDGTVFSFTPRHEHIAKLRVEWGAQSYGQVSLILESRGGGGEAGVVFAHVTLDGRRVCNVRPPNTRFMRVYEHLRNVPCVIRIVPTCESVVIDWRTNLRLASVSSSRENKMLDEAISLVSTVK